MNFYDLMMMPLEKKWLVEKRKWLLQYLKGDVLEIGFGTGANFKLMNHDAIRHFTAIDLEPQTQFEGTEAITFVVGNAEALPFESNHYDAVLETLVLCSVSDLDQSISEVVRVLKNGGYFIFMDHVMPTSEKLQSVFKVINPVWRRVAHGCNLTRTPAAIFEKHGLELIEIQRFGQDIFEYGVARKKKSV